MSNWFCLLTVVQGNQAADNVVKNIRRVEEMGDFDTMIIGRGGGSIEDLWPFNEERVARAIYQANTPVISSVGHETDTTIADLVADVRAATPTAAAELAVPVLSEELMRIQERQTRSAAGVCTPDPAQTRTVRACSTSMSFGSLKDCMKVRPSN